MVERLLLSKNKKVKDLLPLKWDLRLGGEVLESKMFGDIPKEAFPFFLSLVGSLSSPFFLRPDWRHLYRRLARRSVTGRVPLVAIGHRSPNRSPMKPCHRSQASWQVLKPASMNWLKLRIYYLRSPNLTSSSPSLINTSLGRGFWERTHKREPEQPHSLPSLVLTSWSSQILSLFACSCPSSLLHLWRHEDRL